MSALRDRHGKPHPFRALTLAELVETERRIGGALGSPGVNPKYSDVVFVLACALDKTEADTVVLFDGPSSLAACAEVFKASTQIQQRPNIRIPADDLDD